MKTILMTGILALAAMAPLAAAVATEGTSCSVTYGFAWSDTNTCKFTCVEGGTVKFSASASDGTISVSVACGGGSGSCQTTQENPTCEGEFDASSTGEGTCTIDGTSWGVDDGTASCAGTTPVQKLPKCIVEIQEICVPPAEEVLSAGCDSQTKATVAARGEPEFDHDAVAPPCK